MCMPKVRVLLPDNYKKPIADVQAYFDEVCQDFRKLFFFDYLAPWLIVFGPYSISGVYKLPKNPIDPTGYL